MQSKRSRKKENSTKSWNKNFDGSEQYNLNEVYVDYIDEERKKPCFVKFKTDQIEEIIKRHKIFYN